MATRRQRAIDTPRLAADFRRVMKVLEHTPSVDKRKRVARAEFQARARRVETFNRLPLNVQHLVGGW